VLLMLIPLAIGLFVNRRFPSVAARLQRIVSIIGNIGLVIGVVALLAVHGQAKLATFGTGAVTASIVLVAGTLLIGWLIAGADTAARPMLTLGTGARNIPAALVMADLNFDDADVLVMCVLFAVVSGWAGTLLIGWLIAGADTAARPVLTLGTRARNIPAALVVADLNFDDADVLVMCVLFAVVSGWSRGRSGQVGGTGPAPGPRYWRMRFGIR
jgi:predicted Na+-dependent transporter